MPKRRLLLVAVSFSLSSGVYADAGHSHAPMIGTAAEAGEATRTVQVEMTDNRYDRSLIDVRKGEVVRFVVHNKGQLVHEFNIGTRDMHAAHQDEMLTMMQSGGMTHDRVMHGQHGMKGHDDPNSVLLNPGETKELVWKFDRAVEELEFACNVPGHYQAGMVGRFRFEDS